MNLDRGRGVILTGLMLAVSVSSAVAEDISKFKEGDRVEVEHFGKTVQGVVTGIDKTWGQVQVRADDDGTRGARMPAHIRERMLTRSFDPDKVKLLEKAPAQPTENTAAAPKAQSVRTWKSRNGKFSVIATYEGTRDGKVILKKEDGKQLQVPLDKLADEDANYIKTLAEDAENPFAEMNSGETATAPAAVAAKPMLAKTGKAKVVAPKTFSSWTFAPTPPALAINSGIIGQQIRLNSIPDSDTFFEDLNSIHVADDGNRIILSRDQGKVSGGLKFLEVLEMASGLPGNLIALPKETALLDALPGENLIALRSDVWGSRGKGDLTIAQLQADKLLPLAKWRPYESEFWSDIDKAWFLGPDRILTVNPHGKALTSWSTKDASAEFIIPLQDSHSYKLALNSDRSILAISMPKGIALIDVREGKHVATISLSQELSVRSLAFKDDMQQLAAYSDSGITIWDLTTGKELQSFGHPSMRSGKSLGWAGDYLVMDNHYLYDISRGILLWEYEGGKNALSASCVRNGRLWAAAAPTRESIGLAFTAKIPHSAVTALSGQLGSFEELLIAKPGDKFAIKVDVDPGIAPAEEVRSAIAANLAAAGFVVADEADLVLTAVCKSKEPQTIKINTGSNRFRPNPQDIVEKTFTPHATFMELTLRGESIWEQGYLAKPGMMIWINQGETLDQAIERMTRPNVDMLKGFTFASYMTRPGKATANGAYGTSPFAADE